MKTNKYLKIKYWAILTKFARKNYFWLLIGFFICYTLILIFRSSFILDGQRYFVLFDDQMISMRYARNLAQGAGLVWNVGGEKVEGMTNLLWTAYMTIIHLLPLPLAKTSLLIQLTGVGCTFMTLFFIRKILMQLAYHAKFDIFLTLVFTAFYFPLLNWSIVLGTEVSLLTTLLTIATFLTIQSDKNKKFNLWLWIVLGMGTLVRLDFFVVALVIWLWQFLMSKKQRPDLLIRAWPILSIFLVGQTLWRWFYYHDILPNTYYLKMTGYPIFLRLTRGLYVTIKAFNWPVMWLPFIYLYLRRSKYVMLLLALFFAMIIYSIYAGGDGWEYWGGSNRFVAITMPLFFIAFFQAVAGLRQVVKSHFYQHKNRYVFLEIALLALMFLSFNNGNDNTLLQLFLIKAPLTVGENRMQVMMARSLTQLTKSNETIGIVWAGITPYFIDRTFIDLLGKNEKVIAHENAQPIPASVGNLQKYFYFWPGHMKWDYDHILTTYRPDYFAQVYPTDQLDKLSDNYQKVETKEGFVFYAKKK